MFIVPATRMEEAFGSMMAILVPVALDWSTAGDRSVNDQKAKVNKAKMGSAVLVNNGYGDKSSRKSSAAAGCWNGWAQLSQLERETVFWKSEGRK